MAKNSGAWREMAHLPIVFRLSCDKEKDFWTCLVQGTKCQYPYGEIKNGRSHDPRSAMIDLLGKLGVV